MQSKAAILFILITPVLLSQIQVSPQMSPQVIYPSLPAQQIGANDLISVMVYDQPELSGVVRVTGDGLVRLPMLKNAVRAEGLMPADLERSIVQHLISEQLVLHPIVTVTIAEYKSHPISVGGAVNNPVIFQAIQPCTLMEALNLAGGITDNAGPEVLVTKNGLTQRFNLRLVTGSGDPDSNPILTGGEAVRVPPSGQIFVVGDVKHPGVYPIQDKEVSVLQALALAQGMAVDDAISRRAYIYRKDSDGSKKEIPVDLKGILGRKAPDVQVIAQDILYIPANNTKKLGLAVLEKMFYVVASGGSAAIAYSALR